MNKNHPRPRLYRGGHHHHPLRHAGAEQARPLQPRADRRLQLLPAKLGNRGAYLIQQMKDKLVEHKQYHRRSTDMDLPEISGLEVEQRKRQLRRIISFLFLQENQQPARQNPSDRRAFSFNFSILHSNPSFFRQGFCNPLGLQFFLRHAILKSAVLYNRISPDETLRILSPGKGD